MAPFATIYSYPGNPRVKRAQVIAALNGLELNVPADFQMGVTNKSTDFLAKFPLGKVPAMETADGLTVTEAGAICAHLAASGPKADQLLGASVRDRTKVWQWALFAETELVGAALQPFLACVLKRIPLPQEGYDAMAGAFERAVYALDAELRKGNGSFLVGDKISLADVMVGGALCWTASFLFDADMAKGVPAVTKYLEGLLQVPEFKAVFESFQPVAARAKLP